MFLLGGPVVLTPPEVLFNPQRWQDQKWYTYVLQHPALIVGAFGFILVFLSVAGGEKTEFWVFKNFTLSKWSRITSFVTGVAFIAYMLWGMR